MNIGNVSASRAANLQTLVWDLRVFVILHTFLLLVYICLKPRPFCASHYKATSKHSRFWEFWLYFAKRFLWPQTKTGKVPLPSWLLQWLGRLIACDNAYVKRFAKFPDFFETQCWQCCLHVSFYTTGCLVIPSCAQLEFSVPS